MTIADYALLSLYLGMALLVLPVVLALKYILKHGAHDILPVKKWLLVDHHEKAMAFGSLYGVARSMAILGVGLIVFGLLLTLVVALG